MKKILWILAIVPFFAFRCQKDRDEVLDGKVVRLSCGSYVIQLLNNTSIGEDGWKDIMDNNKVYDDVINANNGCQLPASIKTGDLVQFRIANPSYPSKCYVCLIYDAPPSVKLEVRDIRLK